MFELKYVDIRLFKEQVGTLAVFERVTLIFIQTLPSWKALLLDAVEKKNSTMVSDLIHQMKGTSAMMCATPLRDHLIGMERLLLTDGLEALHSALDPLTMLIFETESELQALLLEKRYLQDPH